MTRRHRAELIEVNRQIALLLADPRRGPWFDIRPTRPPVRHYTPSEREEGQIAGMEAEQARRERRDSG